MTDLPRPPFDFVLIGAGRVGTAIAVLLKEAGHHAIGVASRTPESAKRSAERLGTKTFSLDQPIAADVYLLGTGLDAVDEVSKRLAAVIDLNGKVVCHLAGSAGVTPLASCVEAGAFACALHPVQACPDVDTALRRLPGSTWGVTSSPGAHNWVAKLIERDLNGVPVEVEEDDRLVWHAAAVITSNGIAALMSVGESILSSIGITDPQSVLGPLAAGTVANARDAGGGGRTLTGPVVRGESESVALHLAALAELRDELAEQYRRVSELILKAAVDAKRIDGPAAAAVEKALYR